MARYHYWQFLVNQEGQPINAADINIYLAGTTTAANIYTSELGAAYTNTAPQATTNELGYFEFGIGDEAETYGYTKTQKFKIDGERTGVAAGNIDYVDVFPLIVAVDETSSNVVKNKTVSNLLAKGGEDHKDAVFSATVTTEDEDNAHDLQPVIVSSEDTKFNKVLSNKTLYDIINNITNSYSETINTWTSAGSGEYYNTVTHDLSDEHPVIMVGDNTTSLVADVTSIETIDSNNVKITVDDDTLILVVKVVT